MTVNNCQSREWLSAQFARESNPIISTSELCSLQMFIENRINKRNETDSCILRKTCYWDIFSKRFFRTKEVGKKQFRQHWVEILKADKNQWIIKPKRSFNLQPNKTIICEAQAIKSWKFPKRINSYRRTKGCSSEKERKVNALALRAEEGRDYLR